MYKPYNFQVPEKWLNHVENSMHDNRYFIEGKYPLATEEESTLMEDDKVTNTQFEEVSSAEMTQGNMDTMLTENIPSITHVCDRGVNQDEFDLSNKILTLAPGEGKIPVFKDPLAEYLVFRWFKFTLKPPYSIACGKLRLAIWDTSFWTF